MKASDVINRIRRITGIQSDGENVTEIGTYNNALLFLAMDKAIDRLLVLQPREFLKYHRLSTNSLLGNDLFVEPEVYLAEPEQPKNPKPAESYPNIPSENTKTKIGFFYEQSSYFINTSFTYDPSRYRQHLGQISSINAQEITVNPNETKTIELEDLATFLLTVEFYNQKMEVIDIFEANMITVQTVNYYSKVNINLSIDYKTSIATINYANVNSTPITLKFYTSSTSSYVPLILLKDGRVRMINAKQYPSNFLEIESYDRPYSVVSSDQNIAPELTGDLFNFYIAICCLELQTMLKSIDISIQELYNDAKKEFLEINSLKTISKSNSFLSCF